MSYTKFKESGTSLCWWANINYPVDVKTNIIKLLFTKEGLQMNTARYNIGGGFNKDVPQKMRLGGLMPCILNPPPGLLPSTTGTFSSNLQNYNIENDKNQISMLDLAVKAGVTNVEIFSNSPPWWMTKSGYTNGSTKSFDCNLKLGYIEEFVDFLIMSYLILSDRYPGVKFSIEPFNEPSNPFWKVGVEQEGCYFNYSIRNKIIKLIKQKKPSIFLSGVDEFSAGFALIWQLFSCKQVDRVNLHSYNLKWKNITFYFDDLNIFRRLLRRTIKQDIIMSEYGWGYNNTLKDSLPLARHIFRDLDTLKPQGWIYWQVIEHTGSGNWGLMQADFNAPNEIFIKQQFYILKHFTTLLLSGDEYRVVSPVLLEIVNSKQLKYIVLNDSDKVISCKLPKEASLDYVVSSTPEDTFSKLNILPSVYPANSITSIVYNTI